VVGRATSYILGSRKKPDTDNWFIEAAISRWWEQYRAAGEDHRDMAIEGSRIRASWAGMCARRIAYSVAGIEVSNPPTVKDAWRFNIGKLIHDAIQDVIDDLYPGSVREMIVRISDIGSGHADHFVVRHDIPGGRKICVEVKTVNGYGFKRMFGPDGEGPRYSGVVQGALNAAYMDDPPDELIVAVFSLENISDWEAKKLGISGEFNHFAAQWTYTADEYMQIAEEEIARLKRIVGLVDDGELDLVPFIIPDPNLPLHKVITPAKGTIQIYNDDGAAMGTRSTWHCRYCPFQVHCQNEYDRLEQARQVRLLEQMAAETEAADVSAG
jgi:hypothetical protein